MPGPSDPHLRLSGRHVRLVPLEMAHAPALYLAGADPEIWRFAPFRVDGPGDMEAYVRAALDARLRAYPSSGADFAGRLRLSWKKDRNRSRHSSASTPPTTSMERFRGLSVRIS